MKIDVEAIIARKVIAALLKAGYSLGVNDGEEITLRRCKSAPLIFDALRSTDQDYLLVYSAAPREHIGWVRLVWGNGEDVICDYTVNLEPVMGQFGD